MADQSSSREREDRADRGPTAGPPRWVKVSAIIALALVALILLLAGGNHGPGRHQPFRGHGGQLPSVATAAHDWG
jgi:hypothetical protein